MERTGAIGVMRTALGLLVAGPMLAVLAVSRALPPSDLEAAGVSWVPAVLAVILVGLATVTAGASLLDGLRRGRLAALLAAAASSAIAGGTIA